ncbi:hypothetical protein SAMN02910358_00923 [Lachnospiraceae bacterium XBB1006]|nr:hypothetical protein SAMN02910358_00923 [Lachnospiraceae bacterium XBB1006]
MKSTFRQEIIPLIGIVLISGLAMGGLQLLKGISQMPLQPSVWVAGERSDPTLGRGIASIVYGVLSVCFLRIAMRREKRLWEDGNTIFFFSAAGGMLAWVVIGELSWHFGLPVTTKEGMVMTTNFSRIESIQGVWMFFLLLGIVIHMVKRGMIAVTLYVGTFLGNWYGHLCMIATYPMAMCLGCRLSMASWYRAVGLGNAIVFGAVGLWLWRRKTKYLGSVCMYVALGTLFFGTIMGKV